jgi:thioredoxin reductase
MNSVPLPVAVIGAGPVGLAAAAHLIARGATPLVLEAGPVAAHSVRQWGHVRMFTPWRYCIDRAAAGLLAAQGWTHPPEDHVPTGDELVRDYLEPLAACLGSQLHLNARVVSVTRKGADKVRTAGRGDLPFVLRVADSGGRIRIIEAAAVIDASGTWATPNPAGADGLPALGEAEAAGRIAYGMPDVLGDARGRYAGHTVAVLGSGHSALNALIELSTLRREAPDTRILWLMRKERVESTFGGEEADALPERGALGSDARALVESGAVEVVASFHVGAIAREANSGLVIEGEQATAPKHVTADQLIVATGFRPDLSMLREMRLALDPWLESAAGLGPLIDPNLHSCGTVRPHGAKELAHPEPGFFITGIKSYGRAPTFLLATGHEQVRSIAAHLTGDAEAAARVELDLPETGVCSSRPTPHQVAAPASCCGGAIPAAPAVCCTSETPQGTCCAPKPELAAAAPCCAQATAA